MADNVWGNDPGAVAVIGEDVTVLGNLTVNGTFHALGDSEFDTTAIFHDVVVMENDSIIDHAVINILDVDDITIGATAKVGAEMHTEADDAGTTASGVKQSWTSSGPTGNSPVWKTNCAYETYWTGSSTLVSTTGWPKGHYVAVSEDGVGYSFDISLGDYNDYTDVFLCTVQVIGVPVLVTGTTVWNEADGISVNVTVRVLSDSTIQQHSLITLIKILRLT